MTSKDIETLQRVFGKSLLHVFNNSKQATEIRETLDRCGLFYTIGRYIDVDQSTGETCSRLGIEVKRPKRLIEQIFDIEYGEN